MFAGTIDTVATTGLFEIKPNTVNSVPREAKLEIDIRDIDKARRDRIVAQVLSKVKEIAKVRGVESTVDIINQDPPASCSEQVCLHFANIENDASHLIAGPINELAVKDTTDTAVGTVHLSFQNSIPLSSDCFCTTSTM